jgi:putative hydrolase of the HAD superfamily
VPGEELKAVLWDFGGVLTTSPFDAFADYELANGLEAGFIRRLNSTNPDTNAWARLERSEMTTAEFAAAFEAEAAAAGAAVDAGAVLAGLAGRIRPAMVEALERCHEHLKTALLTNNFALPGSRGDLPGPYADLYSHFDVVVESSKAGCRKPDPRFYRIALDQLGVEAAEAVFLDDLGVNLKPARALGMRTIKVVDPAEALAELQALVGFQLA